MKSWLEISEERLTANFGLLAKAAGPNTAVLAVLKANAYGHGAALCAPILARAGASWLGVTDVAEGEAVLHALLATATSSHKLPRVLVMSGLLPEDAEAIVRCGLIPVVWHRRQMEWLLDAAHSSGATVPMHLEIDTGMSRQGVTSGDDLAAVLDWLKAHPQLRLDGVFTHFASAEIAGSPHTHAQRTQFEQAIVAVAESGLRPAWVHAGNSSTVDTEPADQNLTWLRSLAYTVGAQSMVRTGLALYGYCLPIEAASPARPAVQSHLQPALRPVMTWKTRIIGLRDVPPGAVIGYNGIFAAQRPTRLALLPIGYADGLRRELSASTTQPGGWTMVHGQAAAIAGRVSMNLTTIDVTDLPGVCLGDEVIVLGDHITADDHARVARTIAYEILCGIRPLPSLTCP